MVHKSLLVQLNFVELIPTFCNLCAALADYSISTFIVASNQSQENQNFSKVGMISGEPAGQILVSKHLLIFPLSISSCLTFKLQRRVRGFKVIAQSATRIDTKT